MIRFENFTNHHIQREKILLGMIDLAITSMIENDLCYYCENKLDKKQLICKNVDLCHSYIFNGLENLSKQRILERKHEKDFIK